MADLEIEHGHDAAIGLMELTRIPADDRLATQRTGWVAMQPSEAELHERIGPVLRGPIDGLVAGLPERARILGTLGPHDARGGEGRDIERVHAGQDLQVVVDRGVALLGGAAGEVLLTADAVHHIGHGLMDPAVHRGSGDARVVQHRLQGHLMAKGKDERHVGAVAPHDEPLHHAIAFEIDEPHRTPSGLARDGDHAAAELGLDPDADPFSVGAAAGRSVGGCHGAQSAPRNGGRSPPPWAAISAPVTYEASGLARYTQMSPTSAGMANRPMGIPRSMRSRVSPSP